ncbi:hypothetical protein K440DRAFT_664908 [Wilcoxina mikolae CBS 423.85]|nr:hypothetical protein K440DRAFT_664908 [Wilcoxina mikolae CBS 423.85]
MSSTLEKSIEKELTCSICTDLLFDPITFLDCLHTNCGSCSKSWFTSQSTGRDPRPTCPICREPVRETRPNAAFTSLLDDYLSNNPDKKRTPEDVRAARAIYKPGQKVVSGGAIVESQSVQSPTQSPPPTPTRFSPVVQPQRSTPQRNRRPVPPPSPSPSPFLRRLTLDDFFNPAGFPQHEIDQQTRLIEQFFHISIGGGNSSSSSSSTSPVIRRQPPFPPPPPPHTISFERRVPGQPGSIADFITGVGSRVNIKCDSCGKHLDTALHYECTVCSLFHLCISCHRLGKTCPASHRLIPQKQILTHPTPYLQTGLFCSICDSWIDESRNFRTGGTLALCFFWHCSGGCNDGKWNYCLRCVRRGHCCDHKLLLYTNNRSLETGVIRGTPASAADLPLSTTHERWQYYKADCDICHQRVQNWWFHCPDCPDGEYDVCTSCANVLGTDDGKCQRGHKMLALQMGQEGGDVEVLWRSDVKAPEICVGGGLGRPATAVVDNWAVGDEGLGFPKGAGIRDVRKAFEDEVGVWCWGVYCGQKGIFEMSKVRMG